MGEMTMKPAIPLIILLNAAGLALFCHMVSSRQSRFLVHPHSAYSTSLTRNWCRRPSGGSLLPIIGRLTAVRCWRWATDAQFRLKEDASAGGAQIIGLVMLTAVVLNQLGQALIPARAPAQRLF